MACSSGRYKWVCGGRGGEYVTDIPELPTYPPKVLLQLETLAARVGDMVTKFSCAIDGNPMPTISWLKGDTEIRVRKARSDHNNYFSRARATRCPM